MSKWRYTGGILMERSAVSTYQRGDGLVGCVVRTRGQIEIGWGKGVVRYFPWPSGKGSPDPPEFETEAEAEKHAKTQAP